MPITRLKVDGMAARMLVERSAAAPLTYNTVGMTLGWAPTPDGYHDHVTERVVGHGKEVFDKVGYALMHWHINRQAGFQVQAQHDVVREGERVGVVLQVLPFIGVSAICKVVGVVAEGDKIGFAYGTLPKHPQQGEEAFILEHRADDSVVMTVRAISRPAAWYVKLAGPLATAKQRRATTKYLDAAAHFAEAPAPSQA